MAQIDISAGLVPKQQQPIDLSAGLVPANSVTQGASRQGFWSSAADSSGVSALKWGVMHPLQAARAAIAPVNPWAIEQDIRNNPVLGPALGTANELKRAYQDYKSGNTAGAEYHSIKALPIIGPILDKAADQYADRNYSGEAGTLGGFGASIVGPKALGEGLARLPNVPGAVADSVRGTLTRGVDEPIPGTGITPRQRYNSARSLGVRLDAADATNSGILKAVKKVNENSLLGSNAYDKARAQNTTALQDSTSRILNSIYPEDRETGGLAIQNALKRNQQNLQAGATEGFQSLPQDIPLPGLDQVGNLAQTMAQSNAAYQNLFPSLTPNKAMSVVGDVGFGLGSKAVPAPRLSPFVTEGGDPIPSSIQPPSPAPKSFGLGQQLRSDLLEFRRKNPDIVANQGDALVGQLAGAVDQALTDGSSRLTPTELSTFRDANSKWADMKATYDDPRNPLYHAVRSDNPSKLFNGDGLGPRTPENVRNLETRLGPAIAPLRRGVAESALKPTNDGSPNFKTFGTQLNRIPADYRAELFTPAQQEMLGDVQNVSNLVGQDFNPSGSGKLAQKVAETAALTSSPLHPSLAVSPLLQYPIARIMNSQGAVNWLMQPKAFPIRATVGARGIPSVPLTFAPRQKD